MCAGTLVVFLREENCHEPEHEWHRRQRATDIALQRLVGAQSDQFCTSEAHSCEELARIVDRNDGVDKYLPALAKIDRVHMGRDTDNDPTRSDVGLGDP